jgi:6-phosphogluconolactonase
MKKIITTWLLALLTISGVAQNAKEILYTGTYSVRGSEGIYVHEFERSKRNFKLIQSVKTIESPTFLALHPSGKFVYSVNRGAAPGFSKPGSVTAFSIDPSTGKLTQLNHQSSYGAGPCHITIDRSGKLAFVSNYAEGNIVVLSIDDDGSLGIISDSIRFTGSSANKERQDKPHIHSSAISGDNHFLLVADLGTDKIYSFAIDIKNKKLSPAAKPYVTVKPGSGPRHFTFTPDGQYAYLAEELTSTVAAFSFNKKTGALDLIEDQINSLPPDFKERNTSADIHTDLSGKYLFLSNRGHQSIAIYNIEKNGYVTLKGTANTGGKTPRNFLVDNKNEFVLTANQDTDNIVVFDWDAKTGKLTDTGVQIMVPSPVCLKMIEIK